MALVPLLLLTSGCFGGSENQAELQPVVDERGIVTYRFATRSLESPAPVAPPSAGSQPSRTPLDNAEFRQRDLEAYQEMRRNLQERARQQREQDKAEQAYQEMRRNILANQAQEARLRKEIADQRQRLWNQQQSEKNQAESLRLQQASRELDDQLQQTQQVEFLRQQQGMMLRQQRASNGGIVYDPSGSLIIP